MGNSLRRGYVKYFFLLLLQGNPITCDCETLWLRNWVSDDNSAVQDEPICYFPQQLSGNPLKKLRTSRFTCGARSSDLIQDACQGVPVKTPVQQSLSVGLDSGLFACFLKSGMKYKAYSSD